MKRIIRTELDSESETTCGMCGEDFVDDKDGVVLAFYDNDTFQYLCHRCAFEIDSDCGWLPDDGDDDDDMPRFSFPTSTEKIEFPKDQIWREALAIKPEPFMVGERMVHPVAIGFMSVHGGKVTAEVQWVFSTDVFTLGPGMAMHDNQQLPIYRWGKE